MSKEEIAIHNFKFDSTIGGVWIDDKLIKSVTGIDLNYRHGAKVVEVTLKFDASVEVEGELILRTVRISDEKLKEIINPPQND